jgi:hypothetical protein
MLRSFLRRAAVVLACALVSTHGSEAAPGEAGYHQWGRLSFAAEVSASLSPEDEAFFNDTGYSSNPLRRLSIIASASFAVATPVALVTEVRAENIDEVRAYALYLRVKPWANRDLDLQAGLIPPVFGAFGRRPYGSGNPLIGYPLMYQYLTTLRTDAVPASADDLLAVRGRGWLVSYPVGNPYAAPGLPVVDGQQWDLGAQVRIGRSPLQLAVAVTQGSLCEPRTSDDNDGKQVSARLAARPAIGLVLGASYARGEYTDRSLVPHLPPDQAGRTRRQEAYGVDAEFQAGHTVLRVEAIWSRFDLPRIDAPFIDAPVDAVGASLEATHRVLPGLDASARLDRLTFSELAGTTVRDSWDSPVTRLETGLAYAFRRGVVLKTIYQYNWRGAGPPGRRGLPAAQLAWRF